MNADDADANNADPANNTNANMDNANSADANHADTADVANANVNANANADKDNNLLDKVDPCLVLSCKEHSRFIENQQVVIRTHIREF